MSIYNLFLDDTRTPTKPLNGLEWKVARNYDEFVAILEKYGLPELVSFDHDLHVEHMDYYYEMRDNGLSSINYGNLVNHTGLDCAVYLVSKLQDAEELDIPKLNVHSHNRWGKVNIKNYLEERVPNSEVTLDPIPFEYEEQLVPEKYRRNKGVTGL